MELGETPAGYLVQALHPKTGETAGGSFADIPGGRFFDIKLAIGRAAELIRQSLSLFIVLSR